MYIQVVILDFVGRSADLNPRPWMRRVWLFMLRIFSSASVKAGVNLALWSSETQSYVPINDETRSGEIEVGEETLEVNIPLHPARPTDLVRLCSLELFWLAEEMEHTLRERLS